MDLNIPMIFADIASAVAVTLMVVILKKLSDFDKRIQRIEGDLYVAGDNPTSMPLTKQVYTLQQDVSQIRQSCERLDDSFQKLNETLTRLCSEIGPKRIL